MADFKNIYKLLRYYKYRIDPDHFNLSLLSSSSYPHISAISEAMSVYGIESIVADVPKHLFNDLPEVFLAILIIDGKTEIVYTSKENPERIEIVFEDGYRKLVSNEYFVENWSGILLSIEENDALQKEQYPLRNQKTPEWPKYILLLTGLIGTISISSDILSSYYLLSFLTSSVFGAIISFFALKESLGFQSERVSRFCSIIENGNCDKVIFSKGAEVIGGVSISDISFIYFIASVILAFLGAFLNFEEGLFWLSVFAVPFLIYSVYYQAFVVKIWCALCLTIIGVVIAEILSGFIFLDIKFYIPLYFISAAATTYGVLGFIWLQLKPSFTRLANLNFLEIDYYSLVRNPDSLSNVLKNGTQIDSDTFKGLRKIRLGEKNATNSAVVVLSPFCGGCIIAYTQMREVLTYNHKNLYFEIMFNIKTSDTESNIFKIFDRILDLDESGRDVTECLDDFYINKMGEKKWMKKWGIASQNHYALFEDYNRFFAEQNIKNSPTIIFNGSVIHYPYKISDLVYFAANMDQE